MFNVKIIIARVISSLVKNHFNLRVLVAVVVVKFNDNEGIYKNDRCVYVCMILALWWGVLEYYVLQYSVHIVKGDQKGQSKGSGKPILCILFYEKIGRIGEKESKVFLN